LPRSPSPFSALLPSWSVAASRERVARGRADAKAKDVKFGRQPPLTPDQQKKARKRLEAGETQRTFARSYNVSQSTISQLIA
jgi:DNA invertase Pin-like site-specific DNA recombinase